MQDGLGVGLCGRELDYASMKMGSKGDCFMKSKVTEEISYLLL